MLLFCSAAAHNQPLRCNNFSSACERTAATKHSNQFTFIFSCASIQQWIEKTHTHKRFSNWRCSRTSFLSQWCKCESCWIENSPTKHQIYLLCTKLSTFGDLSSFPWMAAHRGDFKPSSKTHSHSPSWSATFWTLKLLHHQRILWFEQWVQWIDFSAGLLILELHRKLGITISGCEDRKRTQKLINTHMLSYEHKVRSLSASNVIFTTSDGSTGACCWVRDNN